MLDKYLDVELNCPFVQCWRVGVVVKIVHVSFMQTWKGELGKE